jgi:hypothetical protein
LYNWHGLIHQYHNCWASSFITFIDMSTTIPTHRVGELILY